MKHLFKVGSHLLIAFTLLSHILPMFVHHEEEERKEKEEHHFLSFVAIIAGIATLGFLCKNKKDKKEHHLF